MHSVHYRQWNPSRSSVRIEFLPAILQQIRTETRHDHDRGFLFGARQQNVIRAHAAWSEAKVPEPGQSDSGIVGVYVSRERGEIFLTDTDIAFLERHRIDVALVLAGERAGFFVRENDGSIQAVRSHEEFDVADATGDESTMTAVRGGPLQKRPFQRWRWTTGALGLLAGPAVALAYWMPAAPIQLEIREQRGNLAITWDEAAMTEAGSLEVIDATGRSLVQLGPGTASATYEVRSDSADIRVSSGKRTGSVHWVKR